MKELSSSQNRYLHPDITSIPVFVKNFPFKNMSQHECQCLAASLWHSLQSALAFRLNEK
jgi:hypothetical protein